MQFPIKLDHQMFVPDLSIKQHFIEFSVSAVVLFLNTLPYLNDLSSY